jgi:glycogen operon protein
MYWDALDFEVPIVPGRRWRRLVDTARPSPEDIVEDVHQAPLEKDRVRVEGRSVLIIVGLNIADLIS